MAQLLFFQGDERLIQYRLSGGRVSIGRSDSCDVALPGDTISRTHCLIRRRDGIFEVIDRSRHGITLDGKSVRRGILQEGGELGIGGYRVIFRTENEASEPTSEAVPERGYELMMGADTDQIVTERAYLVVESGPDAGSRKALKRSRMSVGRRSADVRLSDSSITEEHCFLRVARGRVMVEPGKGAAYIDADRVRAITPLYADETLRIGNTIIRIERGLDESVPFAKTFGKMVGESKRMVSVFGVLRRIAAHHYPVLISGQSGTGKELAARGIHDHGMRSTGPFVAINCGAVASNLFESELFGHEKGAFTDATARKDGAFHTADGGTLFLDEVGELPEASQAKLLRALENGEIRRVGSSEVDYPDVRVIAATNRDLAIEVREGRFREDLFFRLNVLNVEMPSLHERSRDLPLLCSILCRDLHPEAHVTEEGLDALSSHHWPGNIRELRNVLTRAYVMGGPRIDHRNVKFHLTEEGFRIGSDAPNSGTLKDAEKRYIQSVLDKNDGNRSASARELGLARSTLHYKMKKLRIS